MPSKRQAESNDSANKRAKQEEPKENSMMESLLAMTKLTADLDKELQKLGVNMDSTDPAVFPEDFDEDKFAKQMAKKYNSTEDAVRAVLAAVREVDVAEDGEGEGEGEEGDLSSLLGMFMGEGEEGDFLGLDGYEGDDMLEGEDE